MAVRELAGPKSKVQSSKHKVLLFVPQRHQRIDFRCAPRGDVTGDESDDRQQQRNERECQRIGCAYFEQQTLHGPRQRVRAGHSEDNAEENQRHSLFDHHAQHVTRLRSKSHVDANLTRALRHGEREHAVQTNRREQQRQDRQKCQAARRQNDASRAL